LSLDVEALMAEQGISFADPALHQGCWLSLDLFDDTAFDIRTPQQWMGMGIVEGSTPKPLSGFAVREPEGKWEEATIFDYDAEEQLFSVRFVGDDVQKKPRLQVLFIGEDPQDHAERVKVAVERRLAAQARAKFSFIIDNMPADDVPVLDVDKVARILDLSRNNSGLRKAELEETVDEVVKEINLDFGRAMNKIAFSWHCADTEGENSGSTVQKLMQGMGLTVPEEETELTQGGKKEVPETALHPCPPYNFTGVFSDFCFASLFIQPVVITTTVGVRETCLQLLNDLCIYVVQFPRAIRCDQFRQQQKAHGAVVLQRIRDQWATPLSKLVTKEFASLGKGWFNIFETSSDTYSYGKMRKVLLVIRLMMQDTLRDLGIASAHTYAEKMHSFIAKGIDVVDLFTVNLDYGCPDEEKPKALFMLEVKKQEETVITYIPQEPPPEDPKKKKDKKKESKQEPLPDIVQEDIVLSFVYNVDPQEFVDVVLETFSQNLALLMDIPQLEKQIMPQLFRTSTGKQVLASVLPDEKFVVDLKESLQTAYKGNLPSLAQFLKLFDAQLPRLKIDQAEWMAEFNDEENPSGVLELQKQVEKHMGEEKEVNKQVPETRQVGMCDVSMSDVRKLLAAKHSKIVDAALDLILTRYREMASDCARGYQSIITQLQKQATNVEELTAAKEYLQGLPSDPAKLEVEAKGVMKAFDVLEHFRVRVASDDVHQRWRCYSGPKNVDTQIIASELDWAKLEKSFLDEMNEEQQDFDERLNDLTDTINTFSQYSDLNKIEEYYENVLFVNERLAQAFVETKKFNSRETLFNAEPTDYSRLSQLQKSWDPFANLWSIAKKWLDSKDKWLNEDFNAIDEKDLESMVSNGVRQLFKVVKDLKNLDPETTVGILGIAENIKQQLDDFKPYVPLVVGLRNSGMRERHWEEVSTMMKSPVNPEIENFCLQHFIDLGMVQKVEELSDIGDRSGKEFQIEKQLAAMKEAWGPIVFDCSEQYRTTERRNAGAALGAGQYLDRPDRESRNGGVHAPKVH
jgi:dynein heavy chain